MRKLLILAFALLSTTGLFFVACNKDKDVDPESELTFAKDESDMQMASNEALTDMNAAMEGSLLAGKGIKDSICGATIDSSQKANGILIINFDGTTTCGNKKRSGSIKLTLSPGKEWKEAGALITAEFLSYKITRVSDGKSMELDGAKSIKNVNGGLVRELTTGNSVVHQVRGDLTMTFDDGRQREWVLARKRTFTLPGSYLTIQIEGDTTKDGISGVDVIGKNREGNDFYAVISTPIKASKECDWKPVAGVKTHKGLSREVTMTLGVDASGNSISSGCAYGFKVEWTNKRGKKMQHVVAYR